MLLKSAVIEQTLGHAFKNAGCSLSVSIDFVFDSGFLSEYQAIETFSLQSVCLNLLTTGFPSSLRDH